MRYYTAGESHGQGLVAIVEDVPAGLKISEEQINVDLARRQVGYGRGGRMKIERDTAQVISGVRFGRTIGSPVAMLVATGIGKTGPSAWPRSASRRSTWLER